jgi:phospholipase C
MQQYAYANNYYSVFHPSLPNYIALASGDTHGFSTDCSPGQGCSIPGSENNIGDELASAGITWKAYLESMTQPCATSNEGYYAVRHNPFVYFDSIRNDPTLCAAHDVPFDQLQSDINHQTLPQFAWVVPNDCNNMHTQCDQNKTLLQQGEDWLSTWVPKILASKQMQSDGVLVITFDEGTGDSGCCSADPGGGQVLTLVISPNSLVKSGGYASDTVYNHYSLLRTIEDNWGLGYLGHAGDDGVVPMIDFFTGSK